MKTSNVSAINKGFRGILNSWQANCKEAGSGCNSKEETSKLKTLQDTDVAVDFANC